MSEEKGLHFSQADLILQSDDNEIAYFLDHGFVVNVEIHARGQSFVGFADRHALISDAEMTFRECGYDVVQGNLDELSRELKETVKELDDEN